MLDAFLEPTTAAPPATGRPLALALTRDSQGAVWLHARLNFASNDPHARAIAACSLALRLRWEPAPSPRVFTPILGLPMAAETVEERAELDHLYVTVSFGHAFGPGPAPHYPCFVHLSAGAHTTEPLRLDPASLDALTPLGDQLALARELALAPGSPVRLVAAPLWHEAVAACTRAGADPQAAGTGNRDDALDQASQLCTRLLDEEDQRRSAHARRLRSAEGAEADQLRVRLAYLDTLRLALTGSASELEPLFAAPQGRPLLARAPVSIR